MEFWGDFLKTFLEGAVDHFIYRDYIVNRRFFIYCSLACVMEYNNSSANHFILIFFGGGREEYKLERWDKYLFLQMFHLPHLVCTSFRFFQQFIYIYPLWKIWVALPRQHAQEQHYIFLTVHVVFFICPNIWLPVLRLFNGHTDVYAWDCTWRLYGHSNGLCADSSLWEQNPLPHQGIESAFTSPLHSSRLCTNILIGCLKVPSNICTITDNFYTWSCIHCDFYFIF